MQVNPLSASGVKRMDSTKYDKLEYIKMEAIILLVSVIWYGRLFICIGSYTLNASIRIFFCIIISVLTLGTILDWNESKYRNIYGIVRNNVVSLGLYTAIAYFEMESKFIIIVMKISMIMCMGFSVYTVVVALNEKEGQKHVWKEIYQLIQFITRLAGVGFTVILVVVSIKAITGGYNESIGIINTYLSQ